MRCLALLLLLAGCTVGPVAPSTRPLARELPPISAIFGCLRQKRLALVAAEGGRLAPGEPEASMAGLKKLAREGPLLLLAGVGRTADGALVLLSDDRLDAATTARGSLRATSYEALRRAQLKPPGGEPVADGVTSLDEALVWARRNATLLLLDPQPGVPLAEIAAAAREARMAGQVILLIEGRAEAEAALTLPEFSVLARPQSAAETATLLARLGPRLLIETGRDAPPPALLARLDAARASAAARPVPGAGVAGLAGRGAALLLSSQAAEDWEALRSAGRSGQQCLEGETG
jgi:hypothetical protein